NSGVAAGFTCYVPLIYSAHVPSNEIVCRRSGGARDSRGLALLVAARVYPLGFSEGHGRGRGRAARGGGARGTGGDLYRRSRLRVGRGLYRNQTVQPRQGRSVLSGQDLDSRGRFASHRRARTAGAQRVSLGR